MINKKRRNTEMTVADMINLTKWSNQALHSLYNVSADRLKSELALCSAQPPLPKLVSPVCSPDPPVPPSPQLLWLSGKCRSNISDRSDLCKYFEYQPQCTSSSGESMSTGQCWWRHPPPKQSRLIIRSIFSYHKYLPPSVSSGWFVFWLWCLFC